MNTHKRRCRRSGNILVLTAFMMVVMIAMIGFAVDIGYVALVKTQLQASADSAAMAATWDLLENVSTNPTTNVATTLACARTTAGLFAQSNLVAGDGPQLAFDDVAFGRLEVTAGRDAVMSSNYPGTYNAVSVRVRRQQSSNSEVPMFFARALGVFTCPSQAQATAAFCDNFSGFKAPAAGSENLGILPFALDRQSWEAMQAGNAPDCWRWDEASQTISPGSDGVLEVNLYPQGTGAPGNRGTVDIGHSGNSTSDISRQIREGVNADDLAHLDGKIELGPDGTLQLNGDTGISAGVKDDLAGIRGQPRIIPIFSEVSGPGNNAQYVIVQFAGVRIMDVVLTGKMTSRRVMIQPARVEVHGGIPAGDDGQHSHYLHSAVWLVR